MLTNYLIVLACGLPLAVGFLLFAAACWYYAAPGSAMRVPLSSGLVLNHLLLAAGLVVILGPFVALVLVILEWLPREIVVPACVTAGVAFGVTYSSFWLSEGPPWLRNGSSTQESESP